MEDRFSTTIFENRNRGDQADEVDNPQRQLKHTLSNDSELASLTAAHKAMKSLKDLIPCEFSREEITQSADELINSLNAKRKQDTELLADFKRTAELQIRRTCVLTERQMFQVYEKQGKLIQEKIQQLYAILDRISKLETKIQECKQALKGLCHEFND